MQKPSLKARIRLACALLLLAMLLIAGWRTSTPARSPADTWFTWYWTQRYENFPVENDAELASLHENASTASREQCVGCHGDKTHSQLPVHRIHLTSEFLPELACPDCHTYVELGPRGATTAPKWVEVAFCKKCHSAFPGNDPKSHMREEDIESDCTMCHTGARAMRHAQPYLSQIVDPADCKGCHGGRELPWTPRHEQEDWLEHHGMEALKLGTDPCFACHDFGLKFCDDCHAEQPPSHEPSERWKAIHPEKAREDTRVCYTCHDTGECKKCHVNHEEGWAQAHAAVVERRGDESCAECHSKSACSFCHTKAQEGELPENGDDS